MTEPTDRKQAIPRPDRCPACRSDDLTTTSKVQNEEAYWRCLACGEVWNIGRLKAGSRYNSAYPPYRR